MLVAATSVCLTVTATVAGAAALGSGDGSSARPVARIWEVTGTGASAEQARRLADALGLDAALRGSDGSLRYVDAERFLAVPTIDVGEGSRDEHGHATVTRAIDPEALANTRVLPDGRALRLAREAAWTRPCRSGSRSRASGSAARARGSGSRSTPTAQ